ncbi:MAG: cupin [Clostridiales bacterium GWB2_37_7]|nr:MAG: cupin [Clostridiales bacterium GWB2_37_7]
MYTADYFISKLGLEAHIEGGYFKQIYKNSFYTSDEGYPYNFEGDRSLSTTIYFLLRSGQVSKFHKLKFDEVWFYHYGCSMIIHMIDNKGEYRSVRLGLDIEKGEMPQVLVPANVIFGAEPLESDTFSLVSCLVSPGFDYRDFILYEEKDLFYLYPEHTDIIKKLNGRKCLR